MLSLGALDVVRSAKADLRNQDAYCTPAGGDHHDDLARFRRWRITAVSAARKVGSAALDSTNLALDLSVSLTVKTRSSAACACQ